MSIVSPYSYISEGIPLISKQAFTVISSKAKSLIIRESFCADSIRDRIIFSGTLCSLCHLRMDHGTLLVLFEQDTTNKQKTRMYNMFCRIIIEFIETNIQKKSIYMNRGPGSGLPRNHAEERKSRSSLLISRFSQGESLSRTGRYIQEEYPTRQDICKTIVGTIAI